MRLNELDWARLWYGWAFVFLLVGSLLGLFIRWGFLYGMILPLGNLLHAHSHILVLSWLGLMGVGLLCGLQKVPLRKLKWYLTVQIIAGNAMLVGFLCQGYGTLSIVASCLQMSGTFYLFWLYFFRNYFNRKTLLDWAIGFAILSAVGVIGIAPSIIFTGRDSSFFHLSIAFFLHFQIQGWLLTLWLYLTKEYISIHIPLQWQGLWILAVVLTFGFSVNMYFPHFFWQIVNFIGGILQITFALFFVGKIFHKTDNWLIRLALISLLFKAIMHLFTFVEPWAIYLFKGRDIALFYLHWVLIGIIMSGFLGMFRLKPSLYFRWGCVLFITGYVLTEFLLLAGGFPQWFPKLFLQNKYVGLAWAATIMVLGVLLMVFQQFSFWKTVQRQKKSA